MKKITFSSISKNLFGFAILAAVSLACSLGKNPKDDLYLPPSNHATPRPSETPSASPTVSPSKTESSVSSSENHDETPQKAQSFQESLPNGFQMPNDEVGKRILSEYGAVFVARGGVIAPMTVMFNGDGDCDSFQSKLKISSAEIGGKNYELQESAMKALQAAINEAKSQNTNITPRDVDSARRNYSETLDLWSSRVNPALEHWVGKGRISDSEASRIRSLSPTAQVPEILKLEEKGIFFSKDFSKSILHSVAAPGTSQHLSMLAFDINENENAKVREILARHNWYQTVVSDLPHFTYLGVPENDLPKLGLKKASSDGRTFWVPAL